MLVVIREPRYGKNLKEVQNTFFDILKNLKLGFESMLLHSENLRFLEAIGFQTIPDRN